jgi:RHH-type proline utilization regulon transcriptional repressor/proline dehydrogenase/delta 1-pyrroline-5-carboxylate dehydrogenase
VFTRKVYSDVSYLASAKKLLAARDVIFPQFATHNAQTVASIYEMAGPDFQAGGYEFQCLHGMGEPLYSHVVGRDGLARPCRIYAPVGTHGTLLAYLVRRLLENGANSSFVNRISDSSVSVDDLVADPASVAAAIVPPGAPHPRIPLPDAIFGARRNSSGLDLADDLVLGRLAAALATTAQAPSRAAPLLADGAAAGTEVTLRNPANRDDVVGTAVFASPAVADRAFAGAQPDWAPRGERTRILRAAADKLQAALPRFVGLMMREAGKTAANGIAEVREAVDFLRYYADQADGLAHDAPPLGTVVCISPWNFPLSIFTGQLVAALAAGNAVIAKPAEETPLTAAAMVAILHAAGVPPGALQFLPGAGDVGAALCGHPRTAGVVFTGSNEVARLIQKQLAARGAVPLIAETGGINAMIVDSSALTEQVVNDALSSAFDSAGQRCSALRLLCVQDEVADRTIAMLKGAMRELAVGDPGRLVTDVGPVITAEAAERIAAHVATMRAAGHRVTEAATGPAAGTFVPPTLIELDRVDQLTREVFGPVLHVVRYHRAELDRVIDAVNALGFGLTFGLHTRVDATIEHVTERIRAGNIYVNRNIIGAVVGVQPFGGQGMSGTGPKAGGPLYVRRMVRTPSVSEPHAEVLPGPVGERNLYRTMPRGEVLLAPAGREGLRAMLDALAATGNRAVIDTSLVGAAMARELAPGARAIVGIAKETRLEGVLVEGDAARVVAVARQVAELPGKIVPVQDAAGINRGMLVHEVSVSINTAAAGGNASLMALSEG